jgi:hypothetical protein
MLRWDGKPMLWGLLMVGLLSSCVTGPCKSPYQAIVPELIASPLVLPCNLGDQRTFCTVLLESDYHRIVRELKAACLGSGGIPDECQTLIQHPTETIHY